MRFFIVSWFETIPGLPPTHRTEKIEASNFSDFLFWAAMQGIVFTMASHVITDVPAREILKRMTH